jgi:hypothetical protein
MEHVLEINLAAELGDSDRVVERRFVEDFADGFLEDLEVLGKLFKPNSRLFFLLIFLLLFSEAFFLFCLVFLFCERLLASTRG